MPVVNMDELRTTLENDSKAYLSIPDPTGKVATDQTGCFPIRSSLGHQYIMVAYIHNVNVITAIPIKNRSEHSLVDAYSKLYNNLKASGLAPKL